MLQFILGAIGTGKTDCLTEKISQSIAENKDVLVIVPEQFTFEYEHMLYSRLGAYNYNNISVKSFKRLAMQIINESGIGLRRYADNVTKSLIMSLAIKMTEKNDGLVYYNKLAKNASFPTMMLDGISDLSQSGLSDSQLISGCESLKGALKEKFTDILNIYFTYNSLLSKHNLSDSKSAITHSAKLANLNGFFENKIVFIDKFKSFTADERMLIEAMLSQCDVFCALDTDDENSKLLYLRSVNRTFSTLKNLAQKNCATTKVMRIDSNPDEKNADLIHLSKNIFRNRDCEKTVSENIKIVDSLNIYDECEYVMAEIRRLCTHENYNLSDIAIVARDAQMYSSILDEYSKIYDIPLFQSVEKSPYNTALSIFISTSLEMISGKFSTEKLLTYAKTMLIGMDISEVSVLENFCYIWDIDKNLWEKEFTQNDAKKEDAENARKRIIEPLLTLRKKCENATGDQITLALFEHFKNVGLQENLKSLTDSAVYSLEQARELRLLWNVISDTLDIFYTYLKDIEISPSEYRDMFISALSAAHYSNAPLKAECVTFSEIQLARYNSPKIVFIIGANEGYFPRNCVTVGMFTSSESEKLLTNGIELAKTDEQIYSEETFAAFAAMSAPLKKLYLTYPLLDKSNSSKNPAHTLNLIENMFSNRITLCANSLDDEFYASTKDAAYRRYVRVFGKHSTFKASCEKALESDLIYGEKINALMSGTFIKTEHHLDEKASVVALYGDKLKLSASKLETFCSCPFRYFMGYGLKIKPLQKKSITVNEKGSIVHFCLERIFKDFDKERFLSLSHDDIAAAVSKYIEQYRNENLGGDYRESEKFDYNLNIIARNTVEIIENLRLEFSVSDFYPCESEYRLNQVFRLNIADMPKAVASLSGITDRIDLYINSKGRFIRVVDYKTGAKTFKLSDLIGGKNLQMFLYLFALTNDDKKYKSSIPSGVLYYHANEIEPKLERNSNEKKLNELKAKKRKMIGVVLNDEEIIDSMDKGSGFIPVSRNKDGSFSKSSLENILTSDNFKSIDKYCTETVKRCATRIFNGNISALPYGNACEYCDYKNVCGNYPNEIINEISRNEKELVSDMLKGNYSYGDAMQPTKVNPKNDEEGDENVDE